MIKVFAEVGNSFQQIGGDCPAGWVEMPEQRPNDHFVAELVEGVAAWVDPHPSYRKFYGNDKLDLFTPSEQLAVVTATMTDPVVKLVYDRLIGATYLTYEDPETEYGLQIMLDKGLITHDRKVAIVAAMQP